jgi:hypothetical protein
MKKFLGFFLPILAVTIIVYLPILFNPSIVVHQGNDLDGCFWSMFYLVKQQILENHAIPLWNNLILSGTPLLPDPQSPLFYLPNAIFLILPIDTAFIVSFFLHTLISGIGMYLLSNKGLKFSRSASLFCSFVYLTSPKLAGFLMAGHVGLVFSLTYIPFCLWATIKIVKEAKVPGAILLSISLAGLFFTHTLIFLIFSIFCTFLFLFLSLNQKKINIKTIWIFALGAVLSFGLIAITFLPQLTWQKETTRSLLIQDKDTYPKWNSVFEPVRAVVLPWLEFKNFQNIDSEKWIPVGILPIIFNFVGFLFLKRKLKIWLSAFLFILFLIILNNASPIYFFLHNQSWFNLLRVSTRFWMLIIPLVAILSGFAFEKLTKKNLRYGLIIVFALLTLIEPISYSWKYFKKPIEKGNQTPKELYEYLSKDKDLFRVFCTTRCLSQKDSTLYGLELMDGYNTLIQTNFNKQAWQLTQSYWKQYSLSIPPVGTYIFEKLQPRASDLGEYNVKYVISPHDLKDKAFVREIKIGEYFIYRNTNFLPRVYIENSEGRPSGDIVIEESRPGYLRIALTKTLSSKMFISQVYSSGWNIYFDGKRNGSVLERPNATGLVNLKNGVNIVELKYQPLIYQYGKILTLLTLSTIITISFKNTLRKHTGKLKR